MVNFYNPLGYPTGDTRTLISQRIVNQPIENDLVGVLHS